MNNKKENIKIEEQDLFTFIFFPESVRVEKRDLIQSDESFGEILEFYRHLKVNSAHTVDDTLKILIANKIPAYSLSNLIHLYPLKEQISINQHNKRLAADSKELKPKMTTKTFVDNDKEYLIKVLNYEDTTKVFVFSTKEEVVKNFDIIIEPHNLKFHFNDNSEPLILDHSIEADIIQLQFSNS